MKSVGLLIVLIISLSAYTQVSDFSHIDFTKADELANSYKNEALTNLPKLAHNLTATLTTDAERFRAIYKWVCNNIGNDYGMYLKNKTQRERFNSDSIKLQAWNTNFRKRIFKKLLKDKKTICTGYAYLVRELAELSDIECEIVQGFGRISTTDIENLVLPNHSWNAVKLNNKWYLCDPTWASGIPDPETNRFSFQYNDGFFLADPELFAINHFPSEMRWWLINKKNPNFETFLRSPIIYGKTYEKLILHLMPKKMHHDIKKHDKISFAYKLQKTVSTEDIKLVIDNGFTTRKTEPNYIAIKDLELTLKHQFKSKGFYDIHLYIKDDLIATYTAKVNN